MRLARFSTVRLRRYAVSVDKNEARDYWNERYGRGCLFGVEPNVVLVEHCSKVAPGRALDLGCGQGRNAVWLALQGHQVTAVDQSDVAIGQARELAARAGVEIETVTEDVAGWDVPDGEFDLVVLAYVQLPSDQRTAVHATARRGLAHGGTLFLVAHHRDNLEHGVGGPPTPEVLFDEEELAADFAGLQILRNEKVLRPAERDGVSGNAIDVLFVARRPAAPEDEND